MDPYGWLQIAIFVGLIVAATKPMGIYLSRILDPDAQTFLSPLISPVERLFYRLFGLKRQGRTGLAGLSVLPSCIQLSVYDLQLPHHAPPASPSPESARLRPGQS